MKVSDYITEFLISKGIRKCFSVTGGFAMHLNDSFGEKMDVTYTHGENPAGYAALGWSSVGYDPSVCCVTSGCGATNAITPCLIAYQDSVPVLFISGQVHLADNIRTNGGKIRGYFGSDCDIVECVKNITKYAVEITDPNDVPKVIEECYRNLTEGRLGPVWLSVPVDIQSKEVVPYSEQLEDVAAVDPDPDLYQLTEMCKQSERPIILAGNGIHLSKTESEFKKFRDAHNIPYVVTYFGCDLGDDYTGKVGILANRPGNFALQNSDLILCLGCRLSKSISGYNRSIFAKNAKIVCVDIDDSEFLEQKRVDLAIKCDLRTFFESIAIGFTNVNKNWVSKNKEWKNSWEFEMPPKIDTITGGLVCPYRHLYNFYARKPGNSTVVSSSGSIVCVNFHMYRHKTDDRFIISSHGDMGYELPASIGCALNNKKRTYCIIGDGSFQYTIHELQTLKHNNLPVTVLAFNNGGYGAIKITQSAIFKREFGIDARSNLSFCDIEKIANAYDIKYYKVTRDDDTGYLDGDHSDGGPIIVEIVCSVAERYPKIANKLQSDGTYINLPIDQMSPFLSDEEYARHLQF